ncbi:ELL-associated factor 1 [Punica granatum]|uniref:Transcription elongation factor Eaf N-terminal domain-containing protein n=2 Tax=Punica granatum TaxID=22663 RepID=A0A218XMW2_PUNGR|nr:ELL-associated factor 1 [Punica granatum]OWM86254.1 hypothetical protein CDL15_Pgr011078 [Punica granatum]PKI44295.1 hypothetical protein CRG98_035369 [Punica granatum]
MANNSREEPRTAPLPDRWYNLTLGSSFSHQSSSKYCTLRYEFKPASIDKTKPGKLQKNTENRVSVEFQNNQPGKPKVAFEGSSEDYKDNDAVLFFDGETFRLERLHRAVKQLRHVRQPGESASAAAASVASASQPSLPPEPQLSPVGKSRKPMNIATSTFQAMPVEVEHIDIGGPQIPGPKPAADRFFEKSSGPAAASQSPPKNYGEAEDNNHDIDVDELFGGTISDYEEDDTEQEKNNSGVNMNSPRENQSDDEIADVDDCGDDEGERGQNAADALRAQLNAEGGRSDRSSSSSSSSDSGSDSGSSSSSGSEASDDDSVNSV